MFLSFVPQSTFWERSIIALALIGSMFYIGVPTNVNAGSISTGELYELTNEHRNQHALDSFTTNERLEASATAKALDMLNKDYWAHYGPDGESPWDFFAKSGYSYSSAGENLAIDFSTSQGVFNGWLNSPTHLKNIMDPFTEIGIGTATGNFEGRTTTIVVAHYATPEYSAEASDTKTDESNVQTIKESANLPESESTLGANDNDALAVEETMNEPKGMFSKIINTLLNSAQSIFAGTQL